MSLLLLNEEEVRKVLTMDLALEAVETAFRKQALEEATNLPRTRCQTDHAMLHVMSASAKTLGVLGYKAYATSRKGAHFHAAVFDGKTGALQALLQADWLGRVRTGAASGVATKYMARPDAATVGCFGSGKQARTQVEAVCKVRAIRRVAVFSPNEANRRRFAEEMTQVCGVPVEPVARPDEAARDQDIIITATNCREPFLRGDWLREGTHLNVIGSNFLGKAEIQPSVLERCNNLVVDSKDQCRMEAGDFAAALEKGSLHWTSVFELAQVVVDRHHGRRHPGDITLFKSVGIALEDVAVAARVVERAREAGLGRSVDW